MEKILNKITNCDCLNGFKLVPDNSIDLYVSSFPYQNARTYKGFSFDYKLFGSEITRTLKEGGVFCSIIGDTVVNGSETLEPLKQAIYFKEVLGLNVWDTMIYRKSNFSHPEKARYHQTWEYVFVFSKGKPRTFNPIKDRKNKTAGAIGNFGINSFTEADGSKSVRCKKITAEYGMRHNVWDCLTRGQELVCEKLLHPAMAPKSLTRDLIISWSNPGDIVADPCAGAYTTSIMAQKEGRNWIGFECANEYCLYAQELFEKEGLNRPEIVII